MKRPNPDRYDPSPNLVAFLTRRLGPRRASEVVGDLQELARKKSPRLPTVWYWSRSLWLALGMAIARPDDVVSASGSSWTDLRMDLRTTSRSLLRRPAAALTVVATLGLAIGFNAAVFAVLEAIVLKPLPFPEGNRLVVISEMVSSTGQVEDLPAMDVREFQEATSTLSGVSGWQTMRFARTSDGPTESLDGLRVTENLFELLRVSAVAGRTLLTGDQDAEFVTVISEAYWATQFGRDPGVVGEVLLLDGGQYEIVGVMPAGFRFPNQDIDVWVPAVYSTNEHVDRDMRTWNAIARLAPGVTPEDAEAELDGIMASLAETFPDSHAGWEVSVSEAGDAMRDAGTLPLLLAGAVGLILLIACVNAANILFVRSLERTRDVAIRSALGASGGRLARLMLIESLLLAGAAGVLGLGAAAVAVRVISVLDPGVLPAWEPLSIDWSVGLFSFGLATAAALAAGTLPALHVARPGLATTLGEFGNRASGGRTNRKVRHTLVAAEVALTLVLLHGAALLVWSLYSVSTVDPGFDQEQVVTATAVLQGSGGVLTGQYLEIMERVDAIPGVVSAGTVSDLPMNPVGGRYQTRVYSVDYPERTPELDRPAVDIRVASPGYLETLGIPLVEGRGISDSDRPETDRVTVINQELARRIFRDESPVGKRLSLGRPGGAGLEIVGVVGDVKHAGLDAEPRPEVYIGFLQMPHNDLTFAVRALGDPTTVMPAVRTAIAAVAPEVPVVGVATMDRVISGTLRGRRFNVAVFGSVALVALLLACLGIYGVTSYTVSLREREIGIRRAMGAKGADVVSDVVRGTLRLIGMGGAVGVVIAFGASRFLESELFGIGATNPLAYLGAGVVLALIGLIGCLAPAAKAARIDPLTALRAE